MIMASVGHDMASLVPVNVLKDTRAVTGVRVCVCVCVCVCVYQ